MLRTALITTLVAGIRLCAAQPASADGLSISSKQKTTLFEKLWEAVDRKFFDPQFNGVNWAGVKETYRPRVEAAKDKRELADVLQGMVNELHTSHLAVQYSFTLKPESYDAGEDVSPGMVSGPGITLKDVEGHALVDLVAEKSAAKIAGVERGWTLLQWNGHPYDGSAFCHPNETVDLEFLDGQGQHKELNVPCKAYPVAGGSPEGATHTQVLDGGMVRLRIADFSNPVGKWLVHELEANRNAPAIVIDLRGNGGGLLSVLRECLEPWFTKPALIGEFRQRTGGELTLKVSGRGKNAYGGRVFVLIDEHTASAAEIFAAGMQETGRGIVVGRKSGGDVLAAYTQSLPYGFKVDIPDLDYRTAKGIRLEGSGVNPDQSVAITIHDFLDRRDPDMSRVESLAATQP